MLDILSNYMPKFVFLSEVRWNKAMCGGLGARLVWSHLPLPSWDRFSAALTHSNCPGASPYTSLTPLHDHCWPREDRLTPSESQGRAGYPLPCPRLAAPQHTRQAIGQGPLTHPNHIQIASLQECLRTRKGRLTSYLHPRARPI